MYIKEGVFDRIEQSFMIFKSNFFSIIAPLLIFKFLSYIVFSLIFTYIFLNGINFEILSSHPQDALKELYTNSTLMIALVVFITLGLLFAFLILPFYIATWKGIKQAYIGDKINIQANIGYGFKNIGNIFKVYWYIFAYVALIPAILFIVGGGILNATLFTNLDSSIRNIAIFLVVLSLLMFVVFSIYRGNKIRFALINAVEKEDFSQDSFKKTLDLSQGNWWRIFGNFLLLSLLISIIVGGISIIISGIIFVFNFSSSDVLQQPLQNISTGNHGTDGSELIIQEFIGQIKTDSEISILSTVKGIILTFLGVISANFTFIFTFLFLKRLEMEQENNIAISNDTLASKDQVGEL